jgi:hypothetical protein
VVSKGSLVPAYRNSPMIPVKKAEVKIMTNVATIIKGLGPF